LSKTYHCIDVLGGPPLPQGNNYVPTKGYNSAYATSTLHFYCKNTSEAVRLLNKLQLISHKCAFPSLQSAK